MSSSKRERVFGSGRNIATILVIASIETCVSLVVRLDDPGDENGRRLFLMIDSSSAGSANIRSWSALPTLATVSAFEVTVDAVVVERSADGVVVGVSADGVLVGDWAGAC